MSADPLKIHCSECKRVTRHLVCHERNVPAIDDKPAKVCQMVECQGCETVSFRELVSTAEGITENQYPPRMIRAAQSYAASRAPEQVIGVYSATIGAFNTGAENASSFILCSAGVRTMLELICDDLKVGRQLDDLSLKIAGLADEGYITDDQMRYLQDARGQGNDALHRGEIPPQELLASQIDAVEYAIKGLYVMPEPFTKGTRLEGLVVETLDTGVRVRIGKSTRVLIPREEFGDAAAPLPRRGQKLAVKVMTDRGEPLQVSKKEADADTKREEDAHQRQLEADRKRREALAQLRRGTILFGEAVKLENDGILVKVTHNELELEGWIAAADVESRNPRRGDKMELVVRNVSPKDLELYLSQTLVEREKSYQRAEQSYRLRGILEGKVLQPTPDGKLLVQIGKKCVGLIHKEHLEEVEGRTLDDWREMRIPVRVLNEPDREREKPVPLSHKAALRRIIGLENFHPGGKHAAVAGKSVTEGLIVSVGGVEGLIRKEDLTNLRLRTDDKIEVEVIEVKPKSGHFVLRCIPGVNEQSAPDEDFGDDVIDLDVAGSDNSNTTSGMQQ